MNASEDVGVRGGLDTEPTLAALREGRLDELPENHSPFFAPVIEPAVSTGVEALTIAALTWLGTP